MVPSRAAGATGEGSRTLTTYVNPPHTTPARRKARRPGIFRGHLENASRAAWIPPRFGRFGRGSWSRPAADCVDSPQRAGAGARGRGMQASASVMAGEGRGRRGGVSRRARRPRDGCTKARRAGTGQVGEASTDPVIDRAAAAIRAAGRRRFGPTPRGPQTGPTPGRRRGRRRQQAVANNVCSCVARTLNAFVFPTGEDFL
jgi:hypothetical protein